MTYKHLYLEERHYIELSLKKEMSQTDIAAHLGRNQASISREVIPILKSYQITAKS